MKKFIFSKFGDLQAYSWQLYYQTPSQVHFKLPPCSPHVFWLKAHIKFWGAPLASSSPQMGWGGWRHSLSPCSQHLCALWTVGNPDTTVQLAQSLPPYLWYARSCSAQIKFGDLGWAVYAQQPYLPELPYKFKLYVVCSYLPDFIKLQQLLLKTFFLTNLWLKRKFFQST